MEASHTLLLDGQHLTIEDVVAVAHADPASYRLELTADARQRVVASPGCRRLRRPRRDRLWHHDGLRRLLRPLHRSRSGDAAAAQHRHEPCCWCGPPLDTPVVRAMLLIRANTLAKGYSGCGRRHRPALAMLNGGYTR